MSIFGVTITIECAGEYGEMENKNINPIRITECGKLLKFSYIFKILFGKLDFCNWKNICV